MKVTNVPMYALIIQIFFGLMGAIMGCGFGLIILIFGQAGATAYDNICIIESTLNKGKRSVHCIFSIKAIIPCLIYSRSTCNMLNTNKSMNFNVTGN